VSLVEKISELHVSGRFPADDSILPQLSTEIHVYGMREYDAILALSGSDAGIVALAGTGAFGFGRTRDGRDLLLDALGPLYGDHGSGFQIGLAACRAAGRAEWGAQYNTSLKWVVEKACEAMAGCPDNFVMTQFLADSRDRSEIASLAKLTNEEAEKGDGIARQILVSAADDMAETLQCVVERLDMACDEMPLIGAGGVAVHSRLYWSRLIDRVHEFAPTATPELADRPQVLGFALAAASKIGIATPSFRETLLRSRV